MVMSDLTMTPRSRIAVVGKALILQTFKESVSRWPHRLLVAHHRKSIFLGLSCSNQQSARTPSSIRLHSTQLSTEAPCVELRVIGIEMGWQTKTCSQHIHTQLLSSWLRQQLRFSLCLLDWLWQARKHVPNYNTTSPAPYSSPVKNLGLTFDKILIFANHITRLSRTCHMHIHDLCRIQSHFIIRHNGHLSFHFKLDYWNSLLNNINWDR